MACYLLLDKPFQQRKAYRMILALCWIAGLSGGAWAFSSAAAAFDALIYRIPTGIASLSGTLFVSMFSFLLSVMGMYLHNLPIILVTCFCKAFLYAVLSFSSARYCLFFDHFLGSLLFCRSSLSASALYLFWLRSFFDADSFLPVRTALILAFGILFVGIDFRIISPVLEGLI